MDPALIRRRLIDQLLACSTRAAQLACTLSSGDPSYTDYRQADSLFKADIEIALARFGTAIRASRASEAGEDREIMKLDQVKEEDEAVQSGKPEGDKLISILEELVQHLTSEVERRLQVEIVPGIRDDTEAYLEKALPAVEDRILRRLEDRLGMFKGTHPIYATLCSVLARRLAVTVTDDVQTRVYCRIKGHLLNDLEEALYWRVKERLAEAAAEGQTPDDDAAAASRTGSPKAKAGAQTRGRKRSRSLSM